MEVTYFLDPALVAAREAQVPNANFDGGVNLAASNAIGIGLYVAESQTLGGAVADTITGETSVSGDGTVVVAP